MACNSIKKNINKVCASDLDKRISIQTSSIVANNKPGGLASVGFLTIATVWSMIKTSPNIQFIDGVNVENGINTDFYIRYNSSINFEQKLWIEYAGNRFQIANVDNINKDNKFIRLRSIEKGSSSIPVNSR